MPFNISSLLCKVHICGLILKFHLGWGGCYFSAHFPCVCKHHYVYSLAWNTICIWYLVDMLVGVGILVGSYLLLSVLLLLNCFSLQLCVLFFKLVPPLCECSFLRLVLNSLENCLKTVKLVPLHRLYIWDVLSYDCFLEVCLLKRRWPFSKSAPNHNPNTVQSVYFVFSSTKRKIFIQRKCLEWMVAFFPLSLMLGDSKHWSWVLRL